MIPERSRLPHLPALDGLRGLAVIGVLLFHSQYSWARGGYLGVSAFFTLSGFLITTLLLVERHDAGHISLPAFWGRRARRLLPAAFLALAGIMLYSAFVADAVQKQHLRGDVLSALFYVANWHFIYAHQSYAQLFNGTPSPVLHFWSLAIEEQFYLVFPLMATFLLWLGRGKRRIFAGALAVFTVVAVIVSSVLVNGGANTSRVYYGTDTRAPELLIGALLAIVLLGRRRPAARGTPRIALGIAGTGAFVMMLVLWSNTDQSRRWLYRGGFAIHAVLVALVLAESLLPGPLQWALSVRPLRWLGRISYGVYLYHWPVFLWLTPERLHGWSRSELFVLRLAVTLAIAVASFHLLERPVRAGVRFRVWWPRVIAPVTALALLVASIVVIKPDHVPASERIVFAPISKAPPPLVGGGGANAHGVPTTVFVPTPTVKPHNTTKTPPALLLHRPYDGKRPLRVLLVGDSVGQTFGRGLELWANQTGQAQVWNDAHYYCSLARFAPRIVGIGQEGPQAPICDNWATRWPDELARFDPDVTVVLYTVWEFVARKPPGASDWLQPGDPRYDNWELSEYEKAVDVLSARGGKVVWLTVPCLRGQTGPFADTTGQTAKQIHRFNTYQLGRVAKARPDSVRIVDLFSEVCPGGQFRESYGPVVHARPDGAHFSDPGAEAVGGWLMNKILAH